MSEGTMTDRKCFNPDHLNIDLVTIPKPYLQNQWIPAELYGINIPDVFDQAYYCPVCLRVYAYKKNRLGEFQKWLNELEKEKKEKGPKKK